MPGWPMLMHALSNVSWQLVRGQFDTITISAPGWKWFASAHYDMQQGKRTNTAVGEEWGSISNSLLFEETRQKNACQNVRGSGSHQCRSFIVMFPVQIRVDSLHVSCDLPVCCCHSDYSEMLIFCKNLYKVIWLTGAVGLNLWRVQYSTLEVTLILTFISPERKSADSTLSISTSLKKNSGITL